MKEALESKQALELPKVKSLKIKSRFTVTNFFVALSGIVIFFVILFALFPQWLAPYSPTQMNPSQILNPPSSEHWFGTDYFGRDVLSLVIYGSRDSLLIGFASVLVGGILGGIIGSASGYIGGVVDTILMRFIDILMTIPGILLAIAIAAALGPSLMNVVLAVAVAAIAGYARIMRGQVISIKKRPYISASHSIGTSNMRIFLWHVLPNSWSPMFVMATIGLGTSILIGAGLSFLGLGVIKEIPDWGALLSQGRGYISVAWWISTFPGLAITLFVLSVNVIGDNLRDRLDPKTNRTR
ncbi:ABC transporter permease [Bacillus timonensis]|uniref:ABC transporter permease n=1 Tax=Bacillus timonensis TaxID=1033734 RepID=UPI000288F427|nr:ABC transporter permease [Bacillus timonensis]